MSKSKTIQENFLRPMLTAYGSPQTEDHEAFFEMFKRSLGEFSDSELAAAADHITKTNRFHSWPTLPEAMAACRKARADCARSSDTPPAGTPGTGWRISDSGRRWFQIEKGSPEFTAWMAFYRSNGWRGFASACEATGRTWVAGPSTMTDGPGMIAHLERERPSASRDHQFA